MSASDHVHRAGPCGAGGFSLVELVIVIVLIGTLAVLSAGLFSGRSAFSPLLATQQLASATLLAQQAALAGNPAGTLRVEQAANEFRFIVGVVGTSESRTFSLPREGASLSGVSLPLNIDFNELGAPAAGSNYTLTFTGDSTFQLCLSSLGAVYTGSCRS